MEEFKVSRMRPNRREYIMFKVYNIETGVTFDNAYATRGSLPIGISKPSTVDIENNKHTVSQGNEVYIFSIDNEGYTKDLDLYHVESNEKNDKFYNYLYEQYGSYPKEVHDVVFNAASGGSLTDTQDKYEEYSNIVFNAIEALNNIKK